MCPVSECSKQLRVPSVEAIYFCVSSQWRLYTFVCPVIGGSISLCVQTLDSMHLRSRQLRLYTFVCPVSGGSIRLCVQSMEATIRLCVQALGSIRFCVNEV